MKSSESIIDLVNSLPPEYQNEVRNFAQYLLATKVKKNSKKMSMSWAGALREYRDQYTSLELQKKALEWWGD